MNTQASCANIEVCYNCLKLYQNSVVDMRKYCIVECGLPPLTDIVITSTADNAYTSSSSSTADSSETVAISSTSTNNDNADPNNNFNPFKPSHANLTINYNPIIPIALACIFGSIATFVIGCSNSL
jgi:hypothetical protein